MNIVEARRTRLTAQEAIDALGSAYSTITGSLPSESIWTLLVAQSALETGQWEKIFNYNFGNVKAGSDYPAVMQLRCSEVENGVETFYSPPDPHCNFRAYNSAADGAADYVRILKRRPHWWAGLQTGDPSLFIDALATPPKYFTANPNTYKREVLRLFTQFQPLVRARLGGPPQGGPPPAPVADPSTPAIPPATPAAPPAASVPGSTAVPLAPPTAPGSPSGWSPSVSVSSPSSATPSSGAADGTPTPEPAPAAPSTSNPFDIEIVLPEPAQTANLFARLFAWLITLLTALFRRTPVDGGPKA